MIKANYGLALEQTILVLRILFPGSQELKLLEEITSLDT